MSLPRRTVLAGAAAMLAAGVPLGLALTGDSMSSRRLPVVYLPHGGGPWPFVDVFGGKELWKGLLTYLQELPKVLAEPPKAILVISAHWEEDVPTVMTGESPEMFYDYYGFPDEAYRIQWPAKGSPALAARVRELLSAQGIRSAEDPSRGFDHGTFVPLKVAWPGAEVPTVQLSLVKGLDPATHLAVGRALAPLRDEGVFIVGSGMSYHNMRGFGTAGARQASAEFDGWLGGAVTQAPKERDQSLIRWAQAPSGRQSHPREEHLLPLMVVAGAAGEDLGSVPYRDTLIGARVSAVHFGA